VIATNLIIELQSHLRGGTCRAFPAGVRVHLKADDDEIFYYPDLAVVCGPQELDAKKLINPKLIVEILSPSTERIDRIEKARNYRSIATLEEYVLVAQRIPCVTVQRRTDQWRSLIVNSPDSVAELRSIGLSLPLQRIYEGALQRY